MEVSSDQDPMPLNSSYGGGHGDGHMIHNNDHHPAAPHNHIIIPSSNGPIIHTTTMDNSKKHAAARYKECLKNHAASMGGNATDGCGEFLPSGEEGTLESLTCSACHCHRNFHRKEVEGELAPLPCDSFYHSSHLNNRVGPGRRVILGHHHKNILGSESLGYPSRAAATPHHHHQMIMSYNMQGMGMGSLPSESDEQEEDGHGGGGMVLARPPPHLLLKKRFRTKFTQEQKEKMLNFSEKVGWKIQKQEESVVQQFCQEIGVKRRVLKVWMHNNKHNLAKSNNPSTSA